MSQNARSTSTYVICPRCGYQYALASSTGYFTCPKCAEQVRSPKPVDVEVEE